MTSSSPVPILLVLGIPPILLEDRANHLQLNFTATLHINVPDPTFLVQERLGELEIVRGSGFCLKIKLFWNNNRTSESLAEAFGRWISDAEMWTQLLFSTSLQVPGRIDDAEAEGPDFIIDLIRSAPGPAATELLLSTIVPTASLLAITLEFSFNRRGLLHDHNTPPTLGELMKPTDIALRGLWSKEISKIAPIIGIVGYLESMNEGTEYASVISDAVLKISARSENDDLRRSVGNLGNGERVEKRVWEVLLAVLKEKKKRLGNRLKSLVRKDDLIKEELEDSLLFDGEQGGAGDDGDIFLETGTEDDFFEWADEKKGEDEADSIFDWINESEYGEGAETSLFEEFEDSVMMIGDQGAYKNSPTLFEELEGWAGERSGHKDGRNGLLFMEDNQLMPEETVLPRGQDEDMIWI